MANAQRALDGARGVRLQLPKAVIDAEAMVTAVGDVALGHMPPLPELPATAQGVRKVIGAYATECVAIDASARVARDLMPLVQERLSLAIVGAAPTWIEALEVAFAKTLTTFKAKADLLRPFDPRLSSPSEDELARRAEAAGDARRLSALASARRDVGSVLHEQGGDLLPFAMVVDCRVPTDIRQARRWAVFAGDARAWAAESDPLVMWTSVPRDVGRVRLAGLAELNDRLGALDGYRAASLSAQGVSA